MGTDLLLEIGVEEIPAGYVNPAVENLGRTAHQSLASLRISHGEVQRWATPRRLAILVEDVEERQGDLDEEIIGPPHRVAFDAQGAPTPAALGFARNQGVAVEELQVVETARGSYLAVRRRQKGRLSEEILSEQIPNWILGIPFPKSMRWGKLGLRFARPIHWIVALWGEAVIPFRLETLISGNSTRGHRFMSPGAVAIPRPGAYLETCRSAKVLSDPRERAEVIQREARRAATSVGGQLLVDPDLLETLVHLVEYPVAVSGRFEGEFLKLPREVLITAMREHQKFFSVQDEEGRLLPHFVNIANLQAESMDVVRKGNERVLRARLSDARFFFQEDRKKSLEDRVKELAGVVFHAKLGTSLEKVERIRGLAVALAERLEPERVQAVGEAARLCKADLTTDMVGEFPTLQGIMGREYALLEGRDPEVAHAIREHYMPVFAGDRLPSGPVGAMVAIADKLDTIVGCFAVGDTPTGAGDPLGLRRAALGVLHILLDRDYEMDLGSMVDQAMGLLGERIEGSREKVKQEVLGFFRVRLTHLWTSQGHEGSAVEATLAAGFENVPEAHGRLKALGVFMAEEGFDDLALSFKRVLNIVGQGVLGPVDPELFEHPEEATLLRVVEWSEARTEADLLRRSPLDALHELAAQKPAVDRFFDAVLVNVEDGRIRANRLRMLTRLGKVFLRLADFSKITTRP